MKKLKKIVSMLMAVAICVLLPNLSTLSVSAEEPVTYYVKYLTNDAQWRYQVGSTWDGNGYHRELYYLNESIKDGDIVIIEGSNSGSVLNFSVSLSNLTFLHGSSASVTATSIDVCNVLRDSVVAINGNVNTAYVYDNGRCTFNNNVGTLYIQNDPFLVNDTLLHGTVTVGGTVNHVIGQDNIQLHYDLYNFAAGKLVITDGDIKTDAAHYSTSSSAASTTETPQSTPAEAAPAEATPDTTQDTATTTQDTTSSADEYDDVPKTGESNLIFWLLGISAICFAGRYALKKA